MRIFFLIWASLPLTKITHPCCHATLYPIGISSTWISRSQLLRRQATPPFPCHLLPYVLIIIIISFHSDRQTNQSAHTFTLPFYLTLHPMAHTHTVTVPTVHFPHPPPHAGPSPPLLWHSAKLTCTMLRVCIAPSLLFTCNLSFLWFFSWDFLGSSSKRVVKNPIKERRKWL